MQGIRDRAVPDSKLIGTANLLIMPTLDAAHIAFNLLKAAADGLPIGPLLLGLAQPAQIVPMGASVSQIVDLAGLAAYQAIHVQAIKGA